MGVLEMEKKAKRYYDYNVIKAQYMPWLESCKNIQKIEAPLVNNIIYNYNTILPDWKYLNRVQKVAFYMAFVVDDTWHTLNLRFSLKFIEKNKNEPKLTDLIRRRLNQNFQNNLNYVPEYLFVIEFDENSFHIHGVINAQNDLDKIKRIFKTTSFGRCYTKNPMPENKKIVCKNITDKEGWTCYVLKENLGGSNVYISSKITKVAKKIGRAHV